MKTVWLGAVAVAVLATSAALLWESGEPPAQPSAAEVLERHLQRHPKDARALVLQARQHVQVERYALAAEGFRLALAASTKVARDAGVWAEYAEAQGLAQGRTLVGLPSELIDKALALNAAQPRALDLAGSAAWERRDYVGAATHWRVLLAQITLVDVRHAELSAAIAGAEQRARFALPPPPR